MEYMKIHKIMLICFTILVLGVCSLVTNTSANAASWHKGTPKELRGYYEANKKQLDQFPSESIYTNRIFHFSVVLPYYEVENLSYKKIKPHIYRVKGTMQARKPIIPRPEKIETIYYLKKLYSSVDQQVLYTTYSKQYAKKRMKAFSNKYYYIKVY